MVCLVLPVTRSCFCCRRSSGNKGDSTELGEPSPARQSGEGGAAGGSPGVAAPDRYGGPAGVGAVTAVVEADHGDRQVLRSESFHSWKSFLSGRASSGPPSAFGSAFDSRKDGDSSSPSPSPEASQMSQGSLPSSEDDEDHEARCVAAAAGPRNSHSSSGSSGQGAGPVLLRPSPTKLPGAGCLLDRRNSTPSPRPGRPRLQSCPKLLVLVGRHDSTGSTGRDGREARKKGVRWKPVLDDSPRGAARGSLRLRPGGGSAQGDGDDDDDPASLCRGCRERLAGLAGLGLGLDRHHGHQRPACAFRPRTAPHLRRPTVRRRPGGTVAVSEEPDLGSAPDLGAACDAFVRDDSFWRGGKFPGTGVGLACGQRLGSRGILKKMMFWRGPGGPGGPGGPSSVTGEGVRAASDGKPHTASAGNVMESVIVTVEPSAGLPVSTSLPDIAAIRTARGLLRGHDAPRPPRAPPLPTLPNERCLPEVLDAMHPTSVPVVPRLPGVPDSPPPTSVPVVPRLPGVSEDSSSSSLPSFSTEAKEAPR